MQQLLTGEEDTILRNADNNSYPVSHFETNMALNVNQFDLILHTFTQSQHMSTFITSLQKEEMAYYWYSEECFHYFLHWKVNFPNPFKIHFYPHIRREETLSVHNSQRRTNQFLAVVDCNAGTSSLNAKVLVLCQRLNIDPILMMKRNLLDMKVNLHYSFFITNSLIIFLYLGKWIKHILLKRSK